MRRLLSILAVLTLASHAQAVRIADITRLGGQRTNVLTGMGLVVGLKGTGDGGKHEPSINMLAQMLAKMGNPVMPQDLNDAKNVAIVTLTVQIPENGAHDGEQLDVRVTSVGASSSLKGGRLYISPMLGPTNQPFISRMRDAEGRIHEQALPFAMAEGAIVLEDPTITTVGLVRKGATMEVDLPTEQIDRAGRITLVLEDPSANWVMANMIAKVINEDNADAGRDIAIAIDPKNVVVTIPPEERGSPDNFIARVQSIELPSMVTEARVVINDRTGTMIMTGDVEISPVVVSHKGLTISTLTPAPVGLPGRPLLKSSEYVALETTHKGGAKLRDLLEALDGLKVPAEDKISIVKELYKSGKLHAKLIVE
jgi:flagellar P-ring protein precursor FlgI